MRTITALFDSRADAENARDRLSSAGISPDHVTIYDKSALGEDDRNGTSMAQHSSSSMSHGNNEAGRGVSQGQPPEGTADGSEGVHRGILGDFIDDRTGTKIGADAGSNRNALGDFVDADGERRGDHGVSGNATDANRTSNTQHARSDADTGLWASIKHFFQGDDHVYEEGIRRGGFLLSARVDDGAAESATAILTQNANVDLDERQDMWRGEGWAGAPAVSQSGSQTGGIGRVRNYDTTDPQRF